MKVTLQEQEALRSILMRGVAILGGILMYRGYITKEEYDALGIAIIPAFIEFLIGLGLFLASFIGSRMLKKNREKLADAVMVDRKQARPTRRRLF